MAEGNKRPLPAKSEGMANWLLNQAEKPIQMEEIENSVPNESVFELLTKIRKKLRQMEGELESRQQKRTQMQKLKRLCDDFSQSFSPESHPSPMKRIEALQYQARLFLEDPENWDDAPWIAEIESLKVKLKILSQD